MNIRIVINALSWDSLLEYHTKHFDSIDCESGAGLRFMDAHFIKADPIPQPTFDPVACPSCKKVQYMMCYACGATWCACGPTHVCTK